MSNTPFKRGDIVLYHEKYLGIVITPDWHGCIGVNWFFVGECFRSRHPDFDFACGPLDDELELFRGKLDD